MTDEPAESDEESALDLTDVVAIKRTRDRNRRQGRQRQVFWQTVLADETGRREMWRLIAAHDWGHAFNRVFACGPNGFPQSEATWLRAGEQDLALRLYHELLAIAPEGVRLMHLEHDPRFPKAPKK